MKEKRLYSFEYLRYAPLEDLPEAERRLANCAAEACSKSYAPYSDFRVGAAALLDDGEIVSAANQESEVFPSGMCAERACFTTCSRTGADGKSARWQSPRCPLRGNVRPAEHAGR